MTSDFGGTYICPCCERGFTDPEAFYSHFENCIQSALDDNLSKIGQWFVIVKPQGGGSVGKVVDASPLNLLVDGITLDVAESGRQTLTTIDRTISPSSVDRYVTPEEGRALACRWLESFVDGLRRSLTRSN